MKIFKVPTTPGHWDVAIATEEIPDYNKEKGLDKLYWFNAYLGKSAPDRDETFGQFAFAPLPGCCGVVVSTGTLINKKDRGTGLSKRLHDIKESVAKQLGYSLMLSTVEQNNVPQIVGATKRKWKIKQAFINKRTNHPLFVMLKDI